MFVFFGVTAPRRLIPDSFFMYDSDMKIHKYNEMMRHLTRPPDKLSKAEKAEVVKDFYKPKPKPMPILDYINKVNSLYSNSEDPGYIDPKEMEDIKKSLPVSEMVKQPKKKIIKVAKKELPKDWQPKYLNGTRKEDYRGLLLHDRPVTIDKPNWIR